MSSTVDNRVVKMTFDNAQFEEGIRQTMEILAKFEKSLSFEDAGKGFESINKAADNVDLSSLSGKAAKEASKIDQYSAEAATSLGKIDDIAQNADFSPLSRSAYTAVSEVDRAISGINLTQISVDASAAGQAFDAMAAVGLGALMELGGGIENYVVSKLKGLKDSLISPITEGFGEYETQIGAIQTIIANTGMSFDSDSDIDLVNQKLDELNLYADKTIYKFGDMVNAIGRFTSAGLGLEQSTQAVQGVANVAALAGASTQDVSRVLPQLAQALSSGTVAMQDWFSVETANMNSDIFVKTIADVAMHMAEVGKAEQSAYEAGNAILNQGVTMRSALNKVDNKDWAGWFSSDILANSLQLFTYDWKSMTAEEIEKAKDFFRSIGYTTEEEFTAIFEKATMAQRAAQEVRTFSQLVDTLGEAIGSNWTGIWRNVLGDFKQATDTFTLLSDVMSGAIDSVFSGIVNAARIFNTSGFDDIPNGIDLIFGKAITKVNEETGKLEKTGERIKGALDYIIEAISKPLKAIGDAFNEVFGVDDRTLAMAIAAVAGGIKDFAESLIISDSAAQSLHDIFKGLFSVVDLGLQFIVIAAQGLGAVIDTLRVFVDPLIDIILAIFGQIGKLLSAAHDAISELLTSLGTALTPVDNIRKSVLDVIEAFIKWLDIPGKINAVGDGLLIVLDALWKFVDIPGKIQGIADIFMNIVKAIGDFTGWNSAVAESNKIFQETGEQVSVVDIWFKHLLENPIIGFFANIVSALLSPITSLKDFATSIINADEAGRQSILKIFFDDLKSKAEFLIGPLGNLFEAIKNFGEAIGVFGGKVIEAIKNYEPFVAFVESVQSFFEHLPDKLGIIGDAIGTEFSKIQNPIQKLADWLNEKADYLKNVTVEQFVKDVKNSFDGFVNDVNGFVESIKNMTPESFFSGWVTAAEKFVQNNDNFAKSITNITEVIEQQFPGMGGVLTNTVVSIQNGIGAAISGINSFLEPIVAKSETMPEFFMNVFIGIKDAIVGKLGEIKEAFENFSPDDFLKIWSNVSNTISDVVENLFPSLSGKVNDVLVSFTNFFRDVTGGATTWGEVFDNIVTAIKDKISNLPETFTGVFNAISSAVTKVLAFITSQLGKLPGGIGELFQGISSTFEAASGIDSAFNNRSLQDSITSFADTSNMNLTDRFAKDLNDNMDFAGSVKQWVDNQIEKLPEVFNEFLEWIKGIFSGATLDDIVEAVKGLAIGKVILSMKTIVKAIASGINEITGGIGEVIKATAESIKSIGTSVGGVIKGFGEIESSIAYAIKQQNKRNVFGEFAEAMKNIAIAMGIVAASLFVISQIEDPQGAIFILMQMAGVVAVLELVGGLITKWLGKDNGTQLLAAAASIGVLALDMIVAMGAITLLNQFDWAGNTKGLIAGVAMLGVFGLFLAAVTKLGGEGGQYAIQASVGILALVAGMALLLPAIESLNDYIHKKVEGLNGDQLANEIAALVGAFGLVILTMLAMSEALKNAGDHGISAGLGFVLVAQGVRMLIDPIEQLSALPIDNLLVSLFTIVALLAEYAQITEKTSAIDIISTALGIMAFAEAIKVLGSAIVPLTEYDWQNLLAAGVSIAGILAVFDIIVERTKAVDLIATSVGLAIFGASVIEMSSGLSVLADMNSDGVGYAAVAIVALVAALGAVTEWTSGVDLLASSVGMVAFGAAVIEMAAGLTVVADMDSDGLAYSAIAIVGLIAALGAVTEWTSGVDLIASGAAMVIFGASVVEMAAGLAVLADLDSDAVGYSAVAIVGLVAALGAITEWTGGIDLVATSAGMLLYADAIVYISNSVAQLAELDSGNVNKAATALGALVVVFAAVTAWTGGVDLIATAAGLDLFALALVGIASSVKIFVEAINELPSGERIQEIGRSLLAGIGEGMAAGAQALVEGFMHIGDIIIQGIKDFFGIHSPSTLMEEEIGQYLPAGIAEGITGNQEAITGALGGMGEGILSWVQTDGLSMLGEAGTSFSEWFTTDGIDIIIEFGKNVLAKANELKDQFLAWMQSDGIPMLQKAGSDLWNWVTTDGVELFGKFIGWLAEKAGELAGKFAAWMQSDGLPMLGKAASDIWNWITTDGVDLFLKFLGWLGEKALELGSKFGNWILHDAIPFVGEKLGELGQAILDWLAGLPGDILDFITGIDWGEIGDNIVKGIAEGITGGIGWITNAISGLGADALQGIKDFFGIQSPSTVMRDEVGINLVKGIAEGIESSTSEQLMVNAWNKMRNDINNAVPGIYNNDTIRQIIEKDLDGLVDSCEKDTSIQDVINRVSEYFPKQISDAILTSPAFHVKNATPQYLAELNEVLYGLMDDGLGVIDAVTLEAEGKLDPILKSAIDYTNTSVNAYLDRQGKIITSDFQLKAKETTDNITNEITNDPEIMNTGTNLLKGIVEGIDLSEAEVIIHGARNRLINIIREAIPGMFNNEEVLQNIRDEVSGIDDVLRKDATINDIIKAVGEYFPENIANAILKSPAFYVENQTPQYLNELRDTIERLAAEGYSVVDEVAAEDQGQLDKLMYAALEYTNITMSNFLESTGQQITENFELQSEEMANGAYQAGWRIPEAFMSAIGEGFGVFNGADEYAMVTDAINSTGASYVYGTDRIEEANKKLFDIGSGKGPNNWMNNAADILKLAAEYLPKTFADEFQKHADESGPVLRRTLQALLNSTLPMLDDQGAEYITSVHSASEIVNNALQYGFYASIAECINNENATLEELSKAIGQSFPENIASALLEHENLPVNQLAQIADHMHSAMEAAIDDDRPKYIETLTGAYSYIVDSFFYEIDNAKDVQELGEIIGRYFPEGMGTGIVENRDVPMEQMIENLKWMAMNGQLEIPGFEQTGEQLGLAISDGVVVGLFQNNGWEDNGNGYLTEYANNIKNNTEPFHAAGGHIGMSIDTGSVQAWTNGTFTNEVTNGVMDIANLASVPAQQTGQAIGESMVSGADTGLDGMDGTVSDSVSTAGTNADATAKETGSKLGSAIVDGMNEQLNNPDSGLMKAIENVGNELQSKAEQLGTAIGEALVNGIETGLGNGDATLEGFANNVIGRIAQAYPNGIKGGGLGKSELEEVIKEQEFKSRIINVEPDSKTVLTALMNEVLTEAVQKLGDANKTNFESATGEAARTISEANRSDLEEKINAGVAANRLNMEGLLSEQRYNDTLSRIDANLYSVYTRQEDIYNDFLRELSDIRYRQDDIYNALDGNTNDYLRNIEYNTGRDMNIYMDTGSLVGAIANDMDNALGYSQILSSRGA